MLQAQASDCDQHACFAFAAPWDHRATMLSDECSGALESATRRQGRFDQIERPLQRICIDRKKLWRFGIRASDDKAEHAIIKIDQSFMIGVEAPRILQEY